MSHFRKLIIVLITLQLLTVSSIAGENEYQIKAAMLYNFAKFVDWPTEAFGSDGRITFCLVGKSALNSHIQPMQGKLIKGRPLFVRQIARPEDIAGCQLLFVPQSEHTRIPAFLQHANMYSILTIGDQEHFAASGGMIGFYEEDNKIRFEINLETIQKRRLQVSSHLLNLARKTR